MFDIGWQELFLIGLVAIIVIGPKDLPRVLRTVTLGIRKVRGMAREFQDGIDELAREADLHDLRKEIEEGVGGDLQDEIKSIGDPARDVEASVREIGDALEAPEKPEKPKTSVAVAEKPEAAEAAPESADARRANAKPTDGKTAGGDA